MGIKNINTRRPTHPGGILKRHYIEPLSLTISDIAKDHGSISIEKGRHAGLPLRCLPAYWPGPPSSQVFSALLLFRASALPFFHDPRPLIPFFFS